MGAGLPTGFPAPPILGAVEVEGGFLLADSGGVDCGAGRGGWPSRPTFGFVRADGGVLGVAPVSFAN